MRDDALFPPSSRECLAIVHKFIEDELEQRAFMLKKHPDQEPYWLRRTFAAETALMHLEALAGDLSEGELLDIRDVRR